MVFVFGWYDLWLIDYVSCLCHLKISKTTWQVINKQWNQDDLRSRYLDSYWKGWQTRMLVAWHNLIDTVIHVYNFKESKTVLQDKFSVQSIKIDKQPRPFNIITRKIGNLCGHWNVYLFLRAGDKILFQISPQNKRFMWRPYYSSWEIFWTN